MFVCFFHLKHSIPLRFVGALLYPLKWQIKTSPFSTLSEWKLKIYVWLCEQMVWWCVKNNTNIERKRERGSWTERKAHNNKMTALRNRERAGYQLALIRICQTKEQWKGQPMKRWIWNTHDTWSIQICLFAVRLWLFSFHSLDFLVSLSLPLLHTQKHTISLSLVTYHQIS